MKDNFGRAVVTCIAGLGLLAFVIAAPASGSKSGAAEAGADQATSTSTGEVTGGQAANQPAVAEPSGNQTAESVISSWPDLSNKVAKAMIDKYGQPAEVSDSFLVWKDNGPWKQTVVYRDGIEHNFPLRHLDVLAQTINYRVPLDKYNDLARFDGSLTASRTAGTLSSSSDREDMNFLALNLANDIVRGNKTVDEARRFYGKTAALAMTGKTSPYTEGLLFRAMKASQADADHPIVSLPGTGETGTQPGVPGNQPQPSQQPAAPPSPY